MLNYKLGWNPDFPLWVVFFPLWIIEIGVLAFICMARIGHGERSRVRCLVGAALSVGLFSVLLWLKDVGLLHGMVLLLAACFVDMFFYLERKLRGQ